MIMRFLIKWLCFNCHLFLSYKGYFKNPTPSSDTFPVTSLSMPTKLCPFLHERLKSYSLPFGGELNFSVFVLGQGIGAIWIKWKNPCSTPKCWIWVTFDYIVLWVSISLNSLVRGRKKACHRKASILINKQSLSFFTKLLSYCFLCFHCRVKAKQMMEGDGEKREGRGV